MKDSTVYPGADKLEGKTVLVTGGTGFIGSHLVQTLCPYCQVVVISREKKIPGVRTVRADITQYRDLEHSLKNIDIDIVFHAAGNTVAPGRTKDLDYFSTNAIGTKNILDIAARNNAERVIYSSSMEIYGNPASSPVSEDEPAIPVTYYGISKWTGEHYCREFKKRYGLSSAILRYSYVYGPGLPAYRAISHFIHSVKKGDNIVLNNAGKTVIDYIYVKDVVTANILAATSGRSAYQTFNIGSGIGTTIEEVAGNIVEIIGRGSISYLPEEPDIPHAVILDISRAKRHLGFKPGYSLREGLTEQIMT